MLTLTPSSVLPNFARVVSAPIDEAANLPAHLPDELREAPLPRRLEFIAGRRCAAEALRRIGSAHWSAVIGSGPAGEPLWPHGYTGSITHTRGVASAAVAPRAEADSVGFGVDAMVEWDRMQDLSRSVQHACETRLKAGGFDSRTVFTLGFSAKKSLFKCLYPLVRRRFDYRDTAVRRIDMATRELEMELLTSLAPGFHRGRRFIGGFTVNDDHVSTGFCIRRSAR